MSDLPIRREAQTVAGDSLDERVVMAAVHADSRRLDAVVRRARSLADELDLPVVFVTVMTRHPRCDELGRMRERLRRYPLPCHLIATWIAGRGLSSRERDALVGLELVAAAERLSASAVVVGDGSAGRDAAGGVVATIAARLAVSTDLCVAAPDGTAAVAQDASMARGDEPWTTSSAVVGVGSSTPAATH